MNKSDYENYLKEQFKFVNHAVLFDEIEDEANLLHAIDILNYLAKELYNFTSSDKKGR